MRVRGTGCLCCRAATCLIIWSIFILAVSTINAILILTLETIKDGNVIVTLIASIVNILVGVVALAGTVRRKRRLLKLIFWLIMADIVLLIALLILSIVIIERDKDEEGGALAGVIVYYLIVIGFDWILAWTVTRTMNEIDMEKNRVFFTNSQP